MPRLIIQSSEFEGKIFDLTQTKITVGRLPDNTLHLDHGSVSGHHAELTKVDDDYQIRDLNSTNGTRINGAKVINHKLQRGDTLHIGHIQMCYESESAENLQALPDPDKKIELNPTGQSVRPPSFVNVSPLGKNEVVSGGNQPILVIVLLALLALGAVGFLLFKLFGNA